MREDAVVDWSAFLGDVGALSARLADGPARRWAIFTGESYAFAVALMATWQAGATAVVLPNAQPGAIADVVGSTDGLVTDSAAAAPGVPTVSALPTRPRHEWIAQPLARSLAAVELFTSGTTGDRKTVTKTIAHLEDEIAGLEDVWGATLDGRQTLGTVSHQHIYGLLFRVLWPLCAGRVFRSEALLFPEEMLARLHEADRAYLVSTPAHLRRLAMMREAATLGGVCQPFFSSGGAITEATAAQLIETVGFAPFEVFGSTETGGVAWRRQTHEEASLAWTPFVDVRVQLEPSGLLHVASPRVSAAGRGLAPGIHTMGDRVEMLDDGRFLVLGRSDRTVKIADKRLSLPDMEDRLLGHPWVADSALTVVGPVGQSRVGAVIVLTDEGRAKLSKAGRRAVSNDLTLHLAQYWDRVLLPRLFRYVPRLPEDAQGKITAAALTALFDASDPDTPWPVEIVEERASRDGEHASGTSTTRRLRVLRAAVFAGHFPELPVVPGYVQVEWVMEAAAELAGRALTVRRAEALKFRDLLRPEDLVDLRAELSEDGDCLTFRLNRPDGRIVSQGRFWLVDEAAS